MHTELLRLVTAGSVDDGKSTLIGRLLYDTKQIMVDQLEHIEDASRRRGHSYIASMLAIPHVTYAVNKMDLVDFSAARFAEIEADLHRLAERLELRDVHLIPISALRGDNVVDRTDAMPWYEGTTLLEHLETVEIFGDRNLDDRRFPVQWVIRPMADEYHDYRGYAGQVAGGVWRAGDEVVVLPSGLRSRVAAVETLDGPLEAAAPPQSVTIRLEDDVDVSRGDMLADPERPPIVARELTAHLCWMSERPLEPRAKLAVKHTTRNARAIVEDPVSVVDMDTLEDRPSPEERKSTRLD